MFIKNVADVHFPASAAYGIYFELPVTLEKGLSA